MNSIKIFCVSILILMICSISSYSQELDEIVDQLKGPLELTEEQESQFSEILGKYAVQLNDAMEKNEESEEEADPQQKIGAFKSVRDAYRKDLQGVLSDDQFKKYQELVNEILFEMFTDIASIKIMDLEKPLSLTEEQSEQLAPVMGKGLMEIIKVVVKYGDKRMSMPNKVKIGKAMKKIQAEMEEEKAKILSPEQIATWDKIKEENKNKNEESKNK